MTSRSRLRAVVVPALIACIGAAGVGCRGERAGGGRAGGSLRAVELPDLGGFPGSVRAQIQREYDHLRDLGTAKRADRRELGRAYGRVGELLLAYDLKDAAEAPLLDAADLLPSDIRWPYYLGYLYKSEGNFQAAIPQFERVLGLESRNVPSRLHLAEAEIQLGRSADAKMRLREVIDIEPDNAAAYFLLADLAGPDETSRAIGYYEKVLELQPQASVVHYPLALAYRKQGDLERSREHLAKRGDTYIEVHDPLLLHLQQLRTSAQAGMADGSRLMKEGRLSEAAETFERVLKEDSTNVGANLNLGVAYARLGRFDAAMGAFERVVRLDPSNSSAHYNLGLILAGHGEFQEAFEHLQAAVRSDPGNNSARFALAKLLWRNGRCREAVPVFRGLLKTSPGNVEARIDEAECLVRLGEDREALQAIEFGYQASPGQAALQEAVVRVLAASPDAGVRDGQRAVRLAEALVAASRRPETLESLAMAYAELRRFPEAIRAQEEAVAAAARENRAGLADYLRGTLQRYQRGLPCRTPWPPPGVR